MISFSTAISKVGKGWQRHQLSVYSSHASPVLFDAIAEALKGTGLSPKMISFSAAISKFEKGWQWMRAAPMLDEMCAGGVLPSMCSCMVPVLFDRIAEAAKVRLKNGERELSFNMASPALDAIAKMTTILLNDCAMLDIPSHASPALFDAAEAIGCKGLPPKMFSVSAATQISRKVGSGSVQHHC
eukprot:2336090-Karenia_brevis.AAC.1